MNILAIDPGKNGGIALCHGEGVAVKPMPATEGDVLAILKAPIPGVAYIEVLVKHMGAGVPASTMAVYASNHGFIMGALMALGWRVEVITPQSWQKKLELGVAGRIKTNVKGMNQEQAKAEKKRVKNLNAAVATVWKNKLKAMAQRLYPGIDVTLKTADALLILEYGKRCQVTK